MLTKTPIRPIGRYFPIDEDGYVVNITHPKNIVSPWKEEVTAATEYLKSRFGADLHSIYLRGTVAQGAAIEGVSDIDLFALIHPNGTSSVKWETINGFDSSLPTDIAYSHYCTPFDTYHPGLAMIIQTQSTCLYGTDISSSLSRYRPGIDMCLNYKWMKADWDTFHAIPSEKVTPHDVQAILKVIIRTGFELVMEKEKQYTTSLYWCVESFSKYYPKKAVLMRKALESYINPTLHILSSVELVSLVVWLIAKVEKEFNLDYSSQ